MEWVRNSYPEVVVRLDANGAFSATEALDKLKKLSKFKIHSIEQPIKSGQWKDMAIICRESPIPIALDEELIGITSFSGKRFFLQIIKPSFIIIKPTLLGGFQASQEWNRISP